MDEINQTITELADLMDEFRLSEAKLKGDDWKIAFRKGRSSPAPEDDHDELLGHASADSPSMPMTPTAPVGHAISSPMTGIYYSAPSPSAPPFVKVGESVMAGQVVGLIEAMKVFNEIVSNVSGRVDRVTVESGALVQPGEPLLYIV